MSIGSEIFLGKSSPLDFAIDQQLRTTLGTVRRAIACGDAALAFQPVVQAGRPERAAFYEGQIRITDETGRFIPLRDFMPTAEKTELGRQIDCMTLSLALQALADEPTLRLAINMSTRTIGYPDWSRILHRSISQDPQIAERLILDITESAAMKAPEIVRRFMDEVQDYGVSFALDDFGAGYTSFRYLRDFSFDMIKIDGQFIRNIAKHPDNQVLTRALQSIAHHFDMLTIAEDVENAEDAAFLIEMGIDCLQGYYFGTPTLLPPWKSPDMATRQG